MPKLGILLLCIKPHKAVGTVDSTPEDGYTCGLSDHTCTCASVAIVSAFKNVPISPPNMLPDEKQLDHYIIQYNHASVI